jgi:PGF-pre-PGF domain-containing protein
MEKRGRKKRFIKKNFIFIISFLLSFIILSYLMTARNIDSPANNLWNRTINGPQNWDDYGYGVAVDNNSNDIYITGRANWSGTYDIYLGKFNSSGSNLWNVTINGPQNGEDYGQGVAVDNNSNIYVTGYSNWSGTYDIYLGKFNSSGSNLWNVTINGPQNNDDKGYDVAVDNNSNIYVTGLIYWYLNSGSDIYLGKFNSSGSNIWNATLNGIQNEDDRGYGVAVDNNSNIYVTGFSTWSGLYDIYLGKFNSSSGSNIWNATINGPQKGWDEGYDVAVYNNSDIYVTGFSYWTAPYRDIYLGKFNSSGNNIWNYTIHAPQNFSGYGGGGVAVDNNSNIYVTGALYWYLNSGLDLYLGKFNSSGSNLWNATLNSPLGGASDYGYGVAIDNNSNIYVVGMSFWLSYSNADIYLGKFAEDIILPNIQILSPSNNSNSSNANLNINYTRSDDIEISTCWYSNDTYLANTSIANCGNITNVIWSEAKHNVTVWTNDSSGNENFSSVSFTIDRVPNIKIVFPSNNTNTTNINLDVNYTRSDSFSGLFNCWYSNDTYLVNTTLETTCENITSVVWSEGKHNVTIWANDSAGNYNFSSISFTIDTVKPAVTIVYPTNNSNLSDINLDVRYTRSDAGSGLFNCWYSNDTYLANTSLANCENITNIVWTDAKPHNVTVWVNDSTGNYNWTTVSFNVETVKPAVYIVFPTNNSNWSNVNLDVNFTRSDESGLTNCWYSNDTYLANTTLSSCENITDVVWTSAKHNVSVWANDTFGNYNFSSISFTIDTTAPNILILYPVNNTNFTNIHPNINYTASDNVALSSCWYSNDSYLVNTTLTDCGTNITNINWSGAKHNVTVWANDIFGNENYSVITFNASFCTESWICTGWTTCVSGNQLRACIDRNSCTTELDKPTESQTCSSGGISGGGSVGTTGVASTTVTETITPSTGGRSAEVIISNAKIDLTKISINVKELASNIPIDLTINVKEVNFPSETDLQTGLPSSGEGYQAFNITIKGIDKKNIANIILDFKVNKTWLEEKKNFTIEDISLYRKPSNETKWDSLNTTYINNDSVYYYFSAVSPGFSTFLIFVSPVECVPAEKRCFENQVQFCLGNKKWLVSEVCDYQCRKGRCIEKGLQINLNPLVVYPIIGIIVVGVLISFLAQRIPKIRSGKEMTTRSAYKYFQGLKKSEQI